MVLNIIIMVKKLVENETDVGTVARTITCNTQAWMTRTLLPEQPKTA